MSHISKGDVHAYLDGALGAYSEEAARHVREHLDACPECAQQLEAESRLRDEASAILESSTPGPVELDPLEELLARAAASGGQGQADRSEPSGRARPTLGSRMYSLRWAATVVVSLGAGWMARDLSGPAGDVARRSVFEPAESSSVSEPVVTEIGVRGLADQQRMERDNVSGLAEAETSLEAPSKLDAGFAEEATPPESRGAIASDVVGGVVGGGAGQRVVEFDDDARLDQVETLSARQRAQSAIAEGAEPADPRVSGQPVERRMEPASLSDELRSLAPDSDQPDSVSQVADAAPGLLATPSFSTTPFLVPGFPVREVRLTLEAEGLTGVPAGSVVVTQELGDGLVIELQFVPLAGSDAVLREAFQERNDLLGRASRANWGRAVRDVPGGLAVLSGPLTDGELAELLDRALGPR